MEKKKGNPMHRLMLKRKKAGITQADLAKGIGVSRQMISYYENGVCVPSYETLERIANYLNCWVKDIK